MRLVILDSCPAVGEWSAKYVSKRINEFNPGPNKYFVLGLPTGSTPLGMYNKLIDFHKAGKLSFKYVKTFNMDEYVDIPRDHPESYHYFMWNNFFKHIDIDPANVHILDGNAPDLVAECNAFEKKISEAGGVELFIGGIGPDGHIAFNEPGSSLVSRTRIKTLAQDTIEANARFFGNDISKVPRQALTVGVGTVMDSNEVLILVTGAHKSFALYKAIEEGVNHMWTVSAFQQHPNTLMICDEDATLELRVKTVKYFKKHMEPANRMLYIDFDSPFLCKAEIDSNINTNKNYAEDITSPATTTCKCNELDQENKLLKENFSKIYKALEAQSKTLNKHSVFLKKLLEKASQNTMDIQKTNTMQLFPIATIEVLEEVENNLLKYSEKDLISYIKGLIGASPIHKCINLFFTEELMLSLNWDGNQKKIALKKYKLFNKYVFEAVKNENLDYLNFEKAIRIGFRKAKSQIYRRSFYMRNKT